MQPNIIQTKTSMLKIYKAHSNILISKKSNDSITKSQHRGQQAKGDKATSPDIHLTGMTGMI